VENHHFEIRKHLLEYDDVMNKQREVIYGMRREILDGESQEETVREWMEELLDGVVDTYCAEEAHPDDWDRAGLAEAMHRQFDVKLPAAVAAREVASREALREVLGEAVQARYAAREAELSTDLLRTLERWVMLHVIDSQWKDHLLSMDQMKEGIGLRGYGQRDPLTEYKREAFELFQDMASRVKAAVVERLFKVQIVRDTPMELPAITAWADTQESRGPLAGDASRAGAPATPRPAPRTASGEKVGRNDPCPCGSGKKYKKCCYLKQAG
jgi:preprotein translocase subunit SecA